MSDNPYELLPRSSADTQGEVQRVLSKLEASGQDLRILRLVANSSNAFRPFVLFSNALVNRSPFPAGEREIIILHLAACKGISYEWNEHVAMSAAAGVTDAQRAALQAGPEVDLTLFTPSQRLALRLCDELVARGALSPASWTEACDAWGKEGAFDFILATAWWGAFVPTVIQALGLE